MDDLKQFLVVWSEAIEEWDRVWRQEVYYNLKGKKKNTLLFAKVDLETKGVIK